jgi:phosphoribosyl-AMP cyclohydrolase
MDFFAKAADLPPAADAGGRDELIADLKFDERGLIPVIAQSEADGAVLMMAWMNREALSKTLAEGRMTYYSRSRRRLWRKGDESGNIQILRELRADCDGDSLLAIVRQTGAACHLNRKSCFAYALRDGGVVIAG